MEGTSEHLPTAVDLGSLPASMVLDPPPKRKKFYKPRPKLGSVKNRGIPKLTFVRIVQQMVARIRCDFRVHRDAVDGLQDAAEALITERFRRCKKLTELCGIDTIKSRHWNFVNVEEQKAPCIDNLKV